MKVRKFGGILLLTLGVIGILSVMGVQLGSLIRLVLGALILFYAWKKWQQKRHFLGSIMALLGAVLMIGSIHVLLGFFIGILFIWVGWKLFSNKDDDPQKEGQDLDSDFRGGFSTQKKYNTKLNDPFDEEWKKKMKTTRL